LYLDEENFDIITKVKQSEQNMRIASGMKEVKEYLPKAFGKTCTEYVVVRNHT